jgi:site-specific recombinase XerD
MNLNQMFRRAAVERSLKPNTVACYEHWFGQFYRFCRVPASQWTGELVRAWLMALHGQQYLPVSRKQALCALVFVFKHVLKRELGQLELPPMPKVRQTLRIVPSREELGRIFAGMTGQAKLMAAVMYGSGLRVDECCKLRVQEWPEGATP